MLRTIYTYEDGRETDSSTYSTDYGKQTATGSYPSASIQPIKKWIYLNQINRINSNDNTDVTVVYRNSSVPEWDPNNTWN